MNTQEIQYDIFLEGELVDLVCVTEEIVEKTNWHNWFNNEKNTGNMQKHYYPNAREDQLNYLKSEINGNKEKLQVGIVHKGEQTLIGMISLSNIDFLNRKCEIGGLIGETKYKSINFWLEANRLLIRHANESLNMHRIYGGSIAKEVSLFYERLLGFEAEGVLKKDIFKNGRYQDAYLFAKVFAV